MSFLPSRRVLLSILTTSLIVSWSFFGWHPLLNNLSIPPKLERVYADTETFNSSTTWTAPSDVCEVTAEVWGGGGGGFTATGNNGAGGGGGGGYTRGTVPVTPDAEYTITVGALASASNNGNNSSFTGDDSLTVTANGGQTGSDTTWGVGGSAVSVTGHIEASFAGGRGGTPYSAGQPGKRGGGGGGGSATNSSNGGNGGNGEDSSGGNGGSGQATGGQGGWGSTNASGGGAPGAGGGGSGSSSSGGTGAAGRIVLTYTEDPGCGGSGNTPPNKPTNSTPSDTATGVSVNPGLTGSSYSDSDSDPHTDTEWQVDDDSGFGSVVWSRTAGSGEEATTVNTSNGTFANELSGNTGLDLSTQYFWRVRYSDDTDWSEWSDSTSFTTTAGVTSISVDPTSFDYGVVSEGQASSTYPNSTITITNTGDTTVTLDIQGQNTACPWTLSGSVGNDQYVHQYCLATGNDCSSPPTNYSGNELTTSLQTLYASVPPSSSNTRDLDLRVLVPDPSSCYNQQSVDILIQATAE